MSQGKYGERDAQRLILLESNDAGATWEPVENPTAVGGTVTVAEPVSVDDNGGSLTVDGAVDVTDDLTRALGQVVVWDGVTAAEVAFNAPDSSQSGLVTSPKEHANTTGPTAIASVTTVGFAVPNGEGTWVLQVNIANAASVYQIEGSVDGVTYFPLEFVYSTTATPWSERAFLFAPFATGNFILSVNIAGFPFVRINKTAHTAGSDTWNTAFIRQALISLPISTQAGQKVRSATNHDVANVLETLQVGGNAMNPDAPPTAVSAQNDRVRAWYDKYGVAIIRQRKVRESYTAWYRLAEANGDMTITYASTTNTKKQIATLHHPASSTMEVQIARVSVWIHSLSSATTADLLEIRKLNTAPTTGNPAITPGAYKDNAAATECIALAIPTNAGTEVAADSPYGSMLSSGHGVTAAVGATNPITWANEIRLYDFDELSDSIAPLTLRAGQLQGIAIVARFTHAAGLNVRFHAAITYIEETI